jgi:hypothetical protein
VNDLLKKLKASGEELNKEDEQRELLFYLTFNMTVITLMMCHKFRAGYSKEVTQYMAFNVLCLDNNLFLTTGKYLDWRVLNS